MVVSALLCHQEEGLAWVGPDWTAFLSEWLLGARSQLGVQATGASQIRLSLKRLSRIMMVLLLL